jgi:Ca2+-binding EF-hand superfamily protein
MLSEFQKRKLTALFNHHDTNGDGFLGKDDYEQFVEKMGQVQNFAPDSPEYKAAYSQTMAAWEHTRKVADKDQDGRVSLEEFLASYDVTLSDEKLFDQLVIGYAHTIFGSWDRDGDERLSGVEYVALGECYGIAEKATQQAFQHLDRDGNGYLSVEELVQSVREFFGDDPDAPGNWMMGPY